MHGAGAGVRDAFGRSRRARVPKRRADGVPGDRLDSLEGFVRVIDAFGGRRLGFVDDLERDGRRGIEERGDGRDDRLGEARRLIAVGEDRARERIPFACDGVAIQERPVEAHPVKGRGLLEDAHRLEQIGVHPRDVSALVREDALAVLAEPHPDRAEPQSARLDQRTVGMHRIEAHRPVRVAGARSEVVAVVAEEVGRVDPDEGHAPRYHARCPRVSPRAAGATSTRYAASPRALHRG